MGDEPQYSVCLITTEDVFDAKSHILGNTAISDYFPLIQQYVPVPGARPSQAQAEEFRDSSELRGQRHGVSQPRITSSLT